MQPLKQSSSAFIPTHVPSELVREYDYINDIKLLQDPPLRMQEIAASWPPLFYTANYGGHWVACSRQAIVDITSHPELFSSKSDGIPSMGKAPNLIPIATDPPEHTTYRAPLNAALTPRAVLNLEPAFRKMTQALIANVIDKGHCEFLSQVAEPLPVTLFMTMAGMPTDRLQEFRQLAEDATAHVDGPTRTQTLGRINEILAEVIRERQAERRDDLISMLLDAQIFGRNPNFEEMLAYASVMFLGGLETVVNALCWATRYLAIHQDLQKQMRKDPSIRQEAIEEMLRLHGVAQTIRVLTRDHEYNGIKFKKGEKILLLLPAANYDPQAWVDPGKFEMKRQTSHVTFNSGPHRCVGANLARMELRVFFDEWFEKVPTFRLDPNDLPTFVGGMNIGVRRLPLRWD